MRRMGEPQVVKQWQSWDILALVLARLSSQCELMRTSYLATRVVQHFIPQDPAKESKNRKQKLRVSGSEHPGYRNFVSGHFTF